MKIVFRITICILVIWLIPFVLKAQSSIHLVNENTNAAISGAAFIYGDQKGYSDEKGSISLIPDQTSSLFISHVSFGQLLLTVNEVSDAVVSGRIVWQPKVQGIQPVTIIALHQVPQDSLVMAMSNRDRLSHDAGLILTQTPEIAVIRKSGNYGFDPVLRGFKYDRLNIVIDGAQSANAACPNRMDPPTSQIATNMVDRIEILKGPYSLRFGNNFGGTINFISAGPQFTEVPDLYGRISGSYESNGQLYRSEGRLGWRGKAYDVSVFAAWSQGADYTDGHSQEIPAGFQRGSFGTAVALKLNNSQDLVVNVNRNLARDVDFPALPMDLTNDDTWLMNLKHTARFHNRRLQSWNTTFYTTYVDHLMDNYRKLLEPRKVDAETSATTQNYGGRTEGRWMRGKGVWYAGLDLRVDKADGYRTRLFLMGPNEGKSLHDNIWQDSRITKVGLFSEYQMPLSDWRLVLAGRIEVNQANAREPAPEFSALYDDVAILQINPSFSAGATKGFDTGISLGFWLGRAQRSASLTERYINFLPVGSDPYEMVGNPELSSEVNYQTDWTVGWKNRVSQLNLTLFASFLTNFISSEIRNDLEPAMPSAPGVRQFMNLDEAFRTGFEASWGQQLLVGLQHRFQVAYTYADDLDNKEPLPEIAPLDLRYRLTGSYLDNKLLPEISVRHVIKQHRIADSYGETKTPAFTVLDMLVRYQPSLTTSFSVGAYNVLDEAYYEHLSRSVRDASQSPLYAPGRSFILTMAIQLN